jgi:RIO kinase 1
MSEVSPPVIAFGSRPYAEERALARGQPQQVQPPTGTTQQQEDAALDEFMTQNANGPLSNAGEYDDDEGDDDDDAYEADEVYYERYRESSTFRDVMQDDFVAAVPIASSSSSGRAASKAVSAAALQPREHAIGKAMSRLNLSQTVSAQIKLGEKKAQGQNKTQGRDDRATTEQVLDPRTRLILFKLLSSNVISEMNGCISTGKEANVYHAQNEEGKQMAIKVFKTSILVFKDRDKYVSGEHRFRSYSRGNPRKMVKMWAEKEMRNLRRLEACGVPCPKPILLRVHVLVMEFLGKDGWPSPRLKDARISMSRMKKCYLECAAAMHRMYHLCKLVHGDLSEYNMLVHEKQLIIIDVSQSVEMDHPRAEEFLKMDCNNVTSYFARVGLFTINPSTLFRFVVDSSFHSDESYDKFAELVATVEEQGEQPTTVDEQVGDAVFMQTSLPKSLHEIVDYERVNERLMRGDNPALRAHLGMLGAVMPDDGANSGDESQGSDEEDGDSGDEDTEGGEGEREWEERPKKGADTLRAQSKEDRRAHKEKVKEEAREKRKSKIKKHVKKKFKKQAAAGKR